MRQFLKNPEHRDLWYEARAGLALARVYEAGVRRTKRETGVAVAEAAHDAAIDHLGDVSQRILAAPGRSLAGLALKAHVVKTWASRSGGTLARTAPTLTSASLRKFSMRSLRLRKRGGAREPT